MQVIKITTFNLLKIYLLGSKKVIRNREASCWVGHFFWVPVISSLSSVYAGSPDVAVAGAGGTGGSGGAG